MTSHLVDESDALAQVELGVLRGLNALDLQEGVLHDLVVA
jgi:hypothetical protein